MSATLTEKLISVWDREQFRGVMVPGAGSYTAFEIAQAMKADRACMADMLEALEECASYISSPLQMSNDADEAERRSKIVGRARAALSSAQAPKETE